MLTSGTGGMLTTDNAALAKFAREIRMFGKEEGTGEIIHYGNDWFLDEIRSRGIPIGSIYFSLVAA